jgi:tripartite-type tricarboxylate transporter receptor subunit TctC
MSTFSKEGAVRPVPGALRGSLARAVFALGLLMTPLSSADAQPGSSHHPLRIVVGFAAGGPSDIVARVVGTKIGEILGRQVVIENHAGASGNLASEIVAHAPGDGDTLLLTPLVFAVNESLFPNRRFAYKDFAAVAPLAETSNVLVVHPSLDVRSVADLIALAKAKPGGVLYATAGKGTATHVAGELFNMMAGVRLTAVHYRGGGELVKDLLSGEVKVTFSTIPPVLDFIERKALRGIATTATRRDKALPALPTIAESGLSGYDVRLWLGLLAPAGTPKDTVNRIASATHAALESSEVKAVLTAQGFDPLEGTPETFDAFMREEIVKWGKVIKQIGTMDN